MSDSSSPSRLVRLLRPTKGKVVFGIVVAIGVAFTVWWWDGGRYMFIPRRFAAIEPGLIYRSAQIHERLIDGVLEEHGIQVVVDMAPDQPGDEDAAAERAAVKRLEIRKVDVLTLDGSGIGEPVDYIVTLSEMARAKRAGTPILVHCSAGTQRTGAVTAMYRMLYHGWTGPRAFAEYMEFRRHKPDKGHLTKYLDQHFAAIAQALVDAGLLDAVPVPLPRFAP